MMRPEIPHRNVKPTWFGVVFAQHMQDPTMSSELKALIALVATCPRENWKWSSCWMRSRLNWGEDRWKRVMIEARERKFVAITKVSDGKFIKSEYHWNIDIPKPASEAESVRAVDFPTNGQPHAKPRTVDFPSDGKPGPITSSKKQRRVKNLKQGITRVMAPFKPSLQSRNAKTELIPEESWQRLTEYLDTELLAVKWRELKRDNGALRALWAIIPDEDEIIAAIEQAASVHEDAAGIFGMAAGILKQEATRASA
jgi:hypothetical protein